MQTGRIKIYDTMKLFGTLLVVLGHASVFYTENAAFSMEAASPFLAALCRFIYTFHMPLFFFVSGAVYQWQNSKDKRAGELQANRRLAHPFVRFLWAKIKRLLVPYYLVGLLIVFPVLHMLGLTALDPGAYLWYGLIQMKDARHLWFLYTLFQVFLLSYGLDLAANRLIPLFERAKWLRPFRKSAHLVVWLGLLFLSAISYQIPYVPQTAFYLLYFFVGRKFEKIRPSLAPLFKKTGFVLGAVFAAQLFAAAGLLILTLRIYHLFGTNGDFLLNILKFPVALLGIFAVILSSHALNRAAWFSHSRLISLLHKNNMAVYLLHAMILYAIFYTLRKVNILPTLLVAGGFCISILLSVGLASVLRRLSLGWVLGEKRAIKSK